VKCSTGDSVFYSTRTMSGAFFVQVIANGRVARLKPMNIAMPEHVQHVDPTPVSADRDRVVPSDK
jgi:hypothetical protein